MQWSNEKPVLGDRKHHQGCQYCISGGFNAGASMAFCARSTVTMVETDTEIGKNKFIGLRAMKLTR